MPSDMRQLAGVPADTGASPALLQRLAGLVQWLGPREAEAGVHGTRAVHQLLAQQGQQNVQQQGQYLPDMYQRILQRAQAHPEALNIQERPGLMGRTGNVAGYDEEQQQILYDPSFDATALRNTLPHEALHFLNAQTVRLPAAGQHALIEKLLGTNLYRPPAELEGYQPGAFSPVEHSIINEWLGGQRDWPR